MNLRKILLFTLLSSPATFVFAQTPKDTENLRDKFYLRQAMYEANQESFAPPRKNNWSVGIQAGPSMVSGDVRPERGGGFGLNLRKACGHVFSMRLQASMGMTSGMNWRANSGFRFNSALNGDSDSMADYTTAAYRYVFYNFQMRYYDLGVQGIFNIGNINFHQKEPKVSFYGLAGIGGMLYNTKVNALDENGAMYDYSGIVGTQERSKRKGIINSLHNLYDNSYETEAEVQLNKPMIGSRTLLPVAHLGLGAEFKMSRRVSLSLEHRVTWTGNDLLDGHQWEETNTLTANSDYLQYTTIGLNLRLGKGQESYWFQNPMTSIYNDVRDLKRFTKGGEKDSDNDGVPDSRDKEPGTPEGVLVDAQGRAIDSDGDGIQDFRDKEPFSPKGAEVDIFGVSIDSDNDGVIDFYDKEPNSPAGAQADAHGKAIKIVEGGGPAQLGMVNFDLGKSEVKQEYFPTIYQVAKTLRENPSKKVLVVGHADVRGKSKLNEDLSKARAENVARILVTHFGVSKDRVITEFKGNHELLVKSMPVYKNENEALHFLNRRVEFVITE